MLNAEILRINIGFIINFKCNRTIILVQPLRFYYIKNHGVSARHNIAENLKSHIPRLTWKRTGGSLEITRTSRNLGCWFLCREYSSVQRRVLAR